MGVDGGISGSAHHTAADQTETELVHDIHANLDGRHAHRAFHNMLMCAQQFVPRNQRDARVLRQPAVHNIRHMPDEDHCPAYAVPQA